MNDQPTHQNQGYIKDRERGADEISSSFHCPSCDVDYTPDTDTFSCTECKKTICEKCRVPYEDFCCECARQAVDRVNALKETKRISLEIHRATIERLCNNCMITHDHD